MPERDERQRRRRILLVEDSPVISLRTEDMLTDAGFFVVGPAFDIKQALDLAKDELIDAAVIDLNIRGEKSFEVMSVLDKREIPFTILSGYADWTMPEEFEPRPRLTKPIDKEKLIETVSLLAD
ncbi:response regulator [Sphingomicrobium marinum]|uniref:response regulator n=1 Tax=Sphingomicrobium marinum TaxID=1227950 RepID=UPI002240B4F4|nr:response regulator [Sphingomicrobium marinum]